MPGRRRDRVNGRHVGGGAGVCSDGGGGGGTFVVDVSRPLFAAGKLPSPLSSERADQLFTVVYLVSIDFSIRAIAGNSYAVLCYFLHCGNNTVGR